MVKRYIVSFLLIFVIFPHAVFSQSDAGESEAAVESREPEPYSEDEFPPWLRKIRRGEVTLIGSLPFTMFVSNLGVQFAMFAAKDFDSAYSPSVSGVKQLPYTEDEKDMILRNTFITAVSISAAIALADFIIGEIIEKKAAGKKK